MRMTKGTVNGRLCHLLYMETPETDATWSQQIDRAVQEIGTDDIVVIHGRGVAEHRDYATSAACWLGALGAAVYIGEAHALGRGVACCVHRSRTRMERIGDRDWYTVGQPKTAAETRYSAMGSRLWEAIGTAAAENAPYEHQVLVSSRQSAIDAVLDDVGVRIQKTGMHGTRVRAILINGPDAETHHLSGFWTRVLDALGARNKELNGRPAPTPERPRDQTARDRQIRDLQAHAVSAEREHWDGASPGLTVVVVNSFDTWCEQFNEGRETWALHTHLKSKGGFFVIGCTMEWPPTGWSELPTQARIRTHKIE